MPSLQTEIAIMVAILVGAWACKVLAVALYMFCHRRRLERLGLQQQNAEGSMGPYHCHKPTPAHIVKAMPVMSYCNAQHQLHSTHKSHATEAASAPAGEAVNAAAEGQVQQQSDTVASSDQDKQQQPQVSIGMRKSSTSSISAAGTQAVATGFQCSTCTDTDCCPICFTEYEASTEVRQLPCRHFYHTECIDAWLSRDSTCPLCKCPVWAPVTADQADVARAVGSSGSSAAVAETASGWHWQWHFRQGAGEGPRLLQIVVIGGRRSGADSNSRAADAPTTLR